MLFCVNTQAISAISCLCDMGALLCLLHRQALFSAILCLCNTDDLLCLLHRLSQLSHISAIWVLFCVNTQAWFSTLLCHYTVLLFRSTVRFYVFASLFSLSVLFFLSTSFYLLLLWLYSPWRSSPFFSSFSSLLSPPSLLLSSPPPLLSLTPFLLLVLQFFPVHVITSFQNALSCSSASSSLSSAPPTAASSSTSTRL